MSVFLDELLWIWGLGFAFVLVLFCIAGGGPQSLRQVKRTLSPLSSQPFLACILISCSRSEQEERKHTLKSVQNKQYDAISNDKWKLASRCVGACHFSPLTRINTLFIWKRAYNLLCSGKTLNLWWSKKGKEIVCFWRKYLRQYCEQHIAWIFMKHQLIPRESLKGQKAKHKSHWLKGERIWQYHTLVLKHFVWAVKKTFFHSLLCLKNNLSHWQVLLQSSSAL